MKILAKYFAGSKSYGLDNQYSDIDVRYVYADTDVSNILGLNKKNYVCKQNSEEDSMGWELRHFMSLLKNANTHCIEMLFNENWVEKDPIFDIIIKNRMKFINSEKLFRSLKGYCLSERKLALGERAGKIGGKRHANVTKYGYSHKNLVQYIRLCFCGAYFFRHGAFPVSMRNSSIYDRLLRIKNNPELYTKERAETMMEDGRQVLEESFENGSFISGFFDEKLADDIIHLAYKDNIVGYKNSLC